MQPYSHNERNRHGIYGQDCQGGRVAFNGTTGIVLNYVATLKSRKAQELLSNMSEGQIHKRDELAAFFSEFNADMSDYRFDREEANARR